MQAKWVGSVLEFGRVLQRAGPYILLEVVLPGGTLFALLLYLQRTGQLRRLGVVGDVGRGVARAASRAFDNLAYALEPVGAGHGGRRRDGLEPLDMLSPGR